VIGAEVAVTVVLPVGTHGPTSGQAVDSILAQTFPARQLVLVHDASAQLSAQVAEVADVDSRVRAVPTNGRGLSAAWNAGLDAVKSDWVLFLDHDAWLSPQALEKLLDAAAEHPDVDCIFSGWTVVTASGSIERRRAGPRTASGMETMVAHRPFPMYCAISRPDVLRSVGGFDVSLNDCEDWDLWLRLARAGRRFLEIPDHLAWRRIATASPSAVESLLRSGLTVIDRSFTSDPRVNTPLPEHRDGAPLVVRSEARAAWAAHAAGLSIGAGADPAAMLATLAQEPDAVAGSLERIADELYDAVPTGRGEGAWLWWRLPAEVRQALDEFVSGLDSLLPGRCVERRVRRWLEDLVFARRDDPPPRESSEVRASLGRTLSIPVELSSPLIDQQLPAGMDRLHCRPAWRSEPLAGITIPASDGFIPSWVLLDACVAENAWTLAQLLMREGGVSEPDGAQGADVADDWEAFLRQVWGHPDVPEADFYDAEADRIVASTQFEARPGDRPVIDVCGPLPEVRCAGVDELEVEFRVAGEPCWRVPVAAQQGRITANALVAAVNLHGGFELCRAVLRRVLEPGAPGPRTIREALIARAAHVARQPGATRLGQRIGAATGTAGFRAAALPAAARPDLLEDAAAHGEPVALDDRSGAGAVVYDPTLLGLITRATRPVPEPVAEPDILPASLRLSFRRRGGVVHRGVAEPQRAALPILMYHRVAPSGEPAMRQWRVTPEELEEQLSYLASAGYYSTTLEAWRDAVVRRRALPGKPIALTFDDGYADFDAFARPLLERHGFHATLFVVTDRVGATNTWDSAIEELPLMDWDVLRRLSRSGLAIGAHTATHAHLTALPDAEVVRELARSRRAILTELGHTPKAFAAPYGLRDSGIDALIGACGFEVALTCEGAVATFAHNLLRLPRLEVTGGLALDGFVRLLGR
jgi:peptidoglycan/xylan/chitin deacetylase (PgdA/CDA1 family)/GT2 family glycosyltransferase